MGRYLRIAHFHFLLHYVLTCFVSVCPNMTQHSSILSKGTTAGSSSLGITWLTHTHTLIVSPIVSPCVTDSEMQGVYLKSVRSPAVAGKFKMIYKQNHNMDIFSQVGLSGFLWCLLILGPVSQTGVSPCLRCTFNSESPLNMIFSLGLGCVWETVPSNKTLWFLSTVPFSLTKQNTN